MKYNHQHQSSTMIQYQLKQNKNQKMPQACGKWYAAPVVRRIVDKEGLAEHMAAHNTPYSPGTILGLLTDMVDCVREICLEGNAVKIDNLAIFSIGINHKAGAAGEKEFSVAKNIRGVRLRARATGEFSSGSLSLLASLKRVGTAASAGDSTSPGGSQGGGNSGGSTDPGTNPGTGGTGGDGGDDLS